MDELETSWGYKDSIHNKIDKSIKNGPRIDKSKLYERLGFIANGAFGDVFSIRRID